MKEMNKNLQKESITLVLGGNGKTGRKVVERLAALGKSIRIGSRTGNPSFDWNDPTTYSAVLDGITHVYITYYPDIAIPGAVDAIRQFTDHAVQNGVEKLVLLSGRGEEEAQKCEKVIQQAGVEWTILRVSWFFQNFDEGYLGDLIVNGQVALPAGEVKEPFIDTDDIADAAVAALIGSDHAGKIYEMTGPELLTFSEAVNGIAKASGREICYTQISHDSFEEGLRKESLPDVMVSLLSYLFSTVLDGRNAHLTDGVQRILGRQPKSYGKFVEQAVAAGAWQK